MGDVGSLILCLHCGGKAFWEQDGKKHRVYCCECGMQTKLCTSRNHAVDLWNRNDGNTALPGDHYKRIAEEEHRTRCSLEHRVDALCSERNALAIELACMCKKQGDCAEHKAQPPMQRERQYRAHCIECIRKSITEAQ